MDTLGESGNGIPVQPIIGNGQLIYAYINEQIVIDPAKNGFIVTHKGKKFVFNSLNSVANWLKKSEELK